MAVNLLPYVIPLAVSAISGKKRRAAPNTSAIDASAAQWEEARRRAQQQTDYYTGETNRAMAEYKSDLRRDPHDDARLRSRIATADAGITSGTERTLSRLRSTGAGLSAGGLGAAEAARLTEMSEKAKVRANAYRAAEERREKGRQALVGILAQRLVESQGQDREARRMLAQLHAGRFAAQDQARREGIAEDNQRANDQAGLFGALANIYLQGRE